MPESSRIRHAFPAPALVIGVGRLGVSVLENLGANWEVLRRGAQDSTLGNLRLLHVATPGDDPAPWYAREGSSRVLAMAAGQGDLPSLAFDFVLLRSLGLIRLRDGNYDVAVPVDAGPIDVAATLEALTTNDGTAPHAPADAVAEAPVQAVARRRFFRWSPLGGRPMDAVEGLRRRLEEDHDAWRFLGPLLARIRAGGAPESLGCGLQRIHAMRAGRDPSPWAWLDAAAAASGADDEDGDTITLDGGWVSPHDRLDLLGTAAVAPLPGWRPGDLTRLRRPVGTATLPGDPMSPLFRWDAAAGPARWAAQLHLLTLDWERSGWAWSAENRDRPLYQLVEASPLRLGLFDHDGREVCDVASDAASGLEALGARAFEGAVRMWVDLLRESNAAGSHGHDLQMAAQGKALLQSLELLQAACGADPLGASAFDVPAGATPSAAQVDSPAPAERASCHLRGLLLPQQDQGAGAEQMVAVRLRSLGIAVPSQQVRAATLFREVEVVAAPPAVRELDLGAFRSALHGIVRELYDFQTLAAWRQNEDRRPLRLNVYLVADLQEPLCRGSVQLLLEAAHAELLRAFTPLFEGFRTGIDRALVMLPVLWIPHPPDALGPGLARGNIAEEATILDTVHRVRRWVDGLPRAARCVSHVLVNSRVTDRAVLSQRDAARQTSDFLGAQLQHDPADEPWLQTLAIGAAGEDLLGAFVCHAATFPGPLARDYLSARLARDLLRTMNRNPRAGESSEVPARLAAETPAVARLIEAPLASLNTTMRGVAARVAGAVPAPSTVLARTTARELREQFAPGLTTRIRAQVTAAWQEQVRDGGGMDDLVVAARQRVARDLGGAARAVRRQSDDFIEQYARRGRLWASRAAFGVRRRAQEHELRQAESARRAAEAECRRHGIPALEPVDPARRRVEEAAEAKPDLLPLLVGVGMLALALVAPAMAIGWLLLGMTRLRVQGGVLEAVAFVAVPVLVWLALNGLVAWLARRHVVGHVQHVREAVQDLADAVTRVVRGDGGPVPQERVASIQSFLGARVSLAATSAVRGFATHMHEVALFDETLHARIQFAHEAQLTALRRLCEQIGTRPGRGDGEQEPPDDVSQLFQVSPHGRGAQPGSRVDLLVSPQALLRYYATVVGHEEQQLARVPELLAVVGGFERWRSSAPLSDTQRALDYGRQLFEELVTESPGTIGGLREDVGQQMQAFLRRYGANAGFGAQFAGYEGLDPDGIRLVANGAVVAHPDLLACLPTAGQGNEATPQRDQIRAYAMRDRVLLLSLALGIRPQSVRNLRRFESIHDRPERQLARAGTPPAPDGKGTPEWPV